MKYTKLTRSQIEADFPFQNLPDFYEGLDMPDNGCINVSLLLRTLHKLCEQHGVQLIDYATVRQILRDDSGTSPSAKWIVGGEMSGPQGSSILPTPFGFRTDKIALTMGAYTNHVLYPSFGFSLNLSIWEMVRLLTVSVCCLSHELMSFCIGLRLLGDRLRHPVP